ncbi:MAG: hypothetical protein ACFFAS_08650 [Promethearchaeota archaeon]
MNQVIPIHILLTDPKLKGNIAPPNYYNIISLIPGSLSKSQYIGGT